MLKVAMLSKWHVHAVDYAREARQHPELEIASVWDEDVQRGRVLAEELGVPCEASLERVASDPNIRGVVVTTPSRLASTKILAAVRHAVLGSQLPSRSGETLDIGFRKES